MTWAASSRTRGEAAALVSWDAEAAFLENVLVDLTGSWATSLTLDLVTRLAEDSSSLEGTAAASLTLVLVVLRLRDEASSSLDATTATSLTLLLVVLRVDESSSEDCASLPDATFVLVLRVDFSSPPVTGS